MKAILFGFKVRLRISRKNFAVRYGSMARWQSTLYGADSKRKTGLGMTFGFSANTGFLWKELPFLERIRQAAKHGFDAVEFHDEARHEDRAALKDVLAETGLPVSGLNVRMGKTSGCAALPEYADQARRDISEAAEIASDIGAGAIHVVAGVAAGEQAHQAYVETLQYALDQTDAAILIEPICAEQLPGYFLRNLQQADGIIAEIAHPRLKIMFDCYHVFRESGELLENFRNRVDVIGHVQISAVEDRAEPFPGEADYSMLLPAFQGAGYSGRFGCEYRPGGSTEAGLTWREMI